MAFSLMLILFWFILWSLFYLFSYALSWKLLKGRNTFNFTKHSVHRNCIAYIELNKVHEGKPSDISYDGANGCKGAIGGTCRAQLYWWEWLVNVLKCCVASGYTLPLSSRRWRSPLCQDSHFQFLFTSRVFFSRCFTWTPVYKKETELLWLIETLDSHLLPVLSLSHCHHAGTSGELWGFLPEARLENPGATGEGATFCAGE